MGAAQLALAGAALAREDVALEGAAPDELAGGGLLEALGRAPMCLEFRHDWFSTRARRYSLRVLPDAGAGAAASRSDSDTGAATSCSDSDTGAATSRSDGDARGAASRTGFGAVRFAPARAERIVCI